MYQITFSISKTQEKHLTLILASAGITGFYVETSGRNRLLHLFSESNELPDALRGFVPLIIKTADEESWMHSWAESFTGHELTGDIYVNAAGAQLPVKYYRHIITIDPRDSFGDGHHPTTRLCAGLLQDHLSLQTDTAELTMIDAGTGSGLLCIIAYILGVRKIELFDIDELAVSMAKKNLELNGVKGLTPVVDDLYTFIFSKKYDIITANLLTKLLEDNISSLTGALKDEGVLIVSGVSTKWTALVKRLVERNNLIIIKHKKLEDWNGFMLKKMCK